MPSDTFRMLICSNSGCCKTYLLYHMLMKPLIQCDEIYLYAKNLEQEKYQKLIRKMREMSKQVGYDILNVSNDKIIPVSEMDYEDNQNLPACSNELEFILFADDTSIFFEHSDLDVLTSHLNDQLNNVSTWLKANKLSINVTKTKLKVFRPRQKTLPITRQIILENYVLEQVDNTKFLGVYIDQHLEWKTHVNILQLRFLNLSGYFIKLNTICPQNLF